MEQESKLPLKTNQKRQTIFGPPSIFASH